MSPQGKKLLNKAKVILGRRRQVFAVLTLVLTAVAFVVQTTALESYCVSRVIDGDTIELSNGTDVRYIGLDTPEYWQKEGGEWVVDPEPFGAEAKEFNEKLVGGKEVYLEFDNEKEDVYHRQLCYVYVDDKMVNKELLEAGMATLSIDPPNVKYVSDLVASREKGYEERNGFWGAYEVVTAEEVEENPGDYIGEVRKVVGTVKSTYQSSSDTVFLNFGENYKVDFTAVIFQDSLQFFSQKDIDPVNYYRDKWVEVSGKIESYNGPEIIVCHPCQIKGTVSYPVLSVDQTSLDFGEVKRGESKTKSFTVSNSGGGTLFGTISTNRSWIKLNPTKVESNSETINVTVDNSILDKGEGQYTGTVTVTSNGGDKKVSVKLLATCVIVKPHPFRLSSGKRLTFWGSGVVPYDTKINIYTLSGNLVKTIEETEGKNELYWDGTNNWDEKVVPGIYLYTTQSPKEKNIGKITVIK